MAEINELDWTCCLCEHEFVVRFEGDVPPAVIFCPKCNIATYRADALGIPHSEDVL